MKIIHLTHTGFYAGTPFCGCNRHSENEKENVFMHVPYGSEQDKFFAKPFAPICIECLKVWNDE